jgi:hypothetical protein
MIGSVGNDVLVQQRLDRRHILIRNVLAGGPQLSDYFHDGYGIPHQARVGQQAELAPVAQERPARQGMGRLIHD